MAGLVPATHAGAFSAIAERRRDGSNQGWRSETDAPLNSVDARDKPGHDAGATTKGARVFGC